MDMYEVFKAIDDLEKRLPDLDGLFEVMAKIKYKEFKAHLEAGFTEDQALKLTAQGFLK